MYNITFQQMSMFFAVAERLNVSETADALFISQSALSKSIQRLEDGLCIKLFVRGNRGLTLTREGEYLYKKLYPHYSIMCRDIRYAQSMPGLGHKVLRIGYPSTYDSSEDYDKLKNLINEFALQNPEIELIEVLYDFAELRRALAYGEVDIAFGHDFIFSDVRNISTKQVCRSRMCLAMSASHPLAKSKSLDDINFEMLEDEIFYTILFSDESSERRRALALLERYGIHPKDLRFVSNFQTLIHVLRKCQGMSVCGYFPKAPGQGEIVYFEFPLTGTNPVFNATWRSGDISKVAMDFVDIIPGQS